MSRLTEAQAALEHLEAELDDLTVPAKLFADLRRVEDALKRMAQLEKVAELARPVAAQDAGPFGWAHACHLLDLGLTELDNHPDTREPTTTENP